MGYDTTTWTTGASTTSVSSANLTLYAEFGIGASSSTSYAANTHFLIPYIGNVIGSASVENDIHLGGFSAPATSFTTADGAGTNASLVVPKLWYLPDNIYIDGIYSLEGATHEQELTTTWHLMSFDFNSGSTSCLTNGVELADNTQVNAGAEQVYLNSWTVDSPSVSAGKVILATFYKSLGNAYDFSASVKIKYHLT